MEINVPVKISEKEMEVEIQKFVTSWIKSKMEWDKVKVKEAFEKQWNETVDKVIQEEFQNVDALREKVRKAMYAKIQRKMDILMKE